MRADKLKRFHLYTDGYAVFEYVGQEDGIYMFSEVELLGCGYYHTNPHIYIFFNKIEVTDLEEYHE